MQSKSQVLWLVASTSILACSAADGPRPPNATPNNGSGAGGSVGSGGSNTGGGSSTSAGGSSGSSGTTPGGGTAGTISTNTGNGMDIDCGRKMFDAHPKPAEILIVLDRSASMKDVPTGATTTDSKWALVVPSVSQVVTDTNATVYWGLKTFPEGSGSECVAGSVTNRIDVSIMPTNAPAVTDTITNRTTPEGNGTPTGDAINAAVTYLKTLNDNNPKYILLATDGDPSCPMPSDTARSFAVTAIANAAAAGFHTFVVGVATTRASSTATLNQMAQAGLEARNDPNPLATHYYLANTKDELVAELKQITGAVASCSFDLGGPPPVPDNIAVKVGGEKIPRSNADGWEYTSPDNSTLQVYGSWCDKVKASPDPVQIIFACKNDIIN